LTLVLVIAVAALAACDANGPAPSASPIPLEVGGTWTYTTQVREAPSVDTFQIAIVDRVDLDALGPRVSPEEPESAYVWTTRFNGVPSDFLWLWAEGPGGLHAAGGIASDDTLRTWGLEFAYPAEPGTSAPLRRTIYSFERGELYVPADLTQELVAVDEPFETPAGTFQTHVYRYVVEAADDVFIQDRVYQYVAPGVGLVGEVVRGFDPVRGEETGDVPYQTTLLVDRDVGGSAASRTSLAPVHKRRERPGGGIGWASRPLYSSD
jgi:hypothetical protein